MSVRLAACTDYQRRNAKVEGQLFWELWLSSDMKEWNGKEWVPTNPDWDGYTRGYHITQEYSAFVTPAQLEYKRKNMAQRMFANEVLAQFFAAGGANPIPTDLLALAACEDTGGTQ